MKNLLVIALSGILLILIYQAGYLHGSRQGASGGVYQAGHRNGSRPGADGVYQFGYDVGFARSSRSKRTFVIPRENNMINQIPGKIARP